MAKPCPISREKFAELAKTAEVYLMVNGVRYDLEVRDVEDHAQSLGWTFNDRGEALDAPAMIQANVTLIGSKIERKAK